MSWKNILDIESWNIIRNDIENPFVNKHSAGLFDSASMDPVRVRLTMGSGAGTVQGKKIPDSILINWFIVKGSDGKEIPRAQALRFPKGTWTEQRASDWLKDNKIKFVSFEAAKKGNNNFKYFEILDQGEGKPTDIFLFGVIGGWDIDAKTFNDEFRKVKSKEVNIHFNSPGGSVVEGFAIFNLLKESDKTINGFVKGSAMSIAAFIMLSCDVINLPRNCLVMFHNALVQSGGNAKELQERIIVLKKIDALLVEELKQRTRKEESEIIQIMEEERLFTGQEAVDFGIGDNLLDPLKEAANFDVSKFINKNLDKYTAFLQDLKVEESFTDNEPGLPDPNPGGKEMDWTEAQNKFKSEITAAIKVGTETALKVALPKAVTEALPAAVTEAIKIENERIAAIETLSVEGNEAIKKIITDAKADPKATKESVAVLIIDAQNKEAKEKKDKIDKDNKTLTDQTDKINTDPPTDEEQTAADKEAAELAAEENANKGYEAKK